MSGSTVLTKTTSGNSGMRGSCNDSRGWPSAWALTLTILVAFCLTVDSTAHGATVRDEFNAISFNGNDGTGNWSGDWQELGESDGPGAGFIRVLANGNCTAANCMRMGINGDNDLRILYREADLSGAATATFTYDFRTLNADRGFVHVEVSGNGGGSWTTLTTYDLNAGDAAGTESFDISAFIAADTRIRFRATNRADNPASMDQFRGFIFFDDVLIDFDAPAAPLDIIKRAFWPDGTPIPTGATIPSGLEYKYLLYINNPDIARADVTVRDVLDPAFQYQAATIQVVNSVAGCALAACTAAEEQAIFTAVDGAAFLTDSADGDLASYTSGSSSVDAGDGNVANLQLNINGNAVWAILFSVKMT